MRDYIVALKTPVINFVPHEWLLFVRESMEARKTMEPKYFSPNVKATNERFIVDVPSQLNWNFVYLFANLCKRFDFDDCYEINTEEKIIAMKTKYLTYVRDRSERPEEEEEEEEEYRSGLSETYANDLASVLLQFAFTPTVDHEIRLMALSEITGVNFFMIWSIDYDARQRKEVPASEDGTITTSFGVEYLVFLLPSIKFHEAIENVWVKVGNKCALPSCSKRDPHMTCGRCGEAKYCNAEHQKKHWKEHRLVCRQPKSYV
jgi:hypothetical protein